MPLDFSFSIQPSQICYEKLLEAFVFPTSSLHNLCKRKLL